MALQKRWMKYFDPDTVARLSRIGFSPLGLVAGNRVGSHRSPFYGFAIEFAGHRGYVPGDDVKHIDWKVYYRTGRYLTKQYEQETNLLCEILVDVSRSMEFSYQNGRKSEYAAWLAVSLAQLIVGQTDSVNVRFFADRLLHETGLTNQDDISAKIVSFYEEYEPIGHSQIGTTLTQVNESIRRRHIVFVISDFFDEPDSIFDGVKRLLGNQHEVILIQIVDPLELSLDLSGRIRFLEMEGEGHIDLYGAQIRRSYEELFHAFLDEMKNRSRALGVDYLLCDTSRPFGIVLAEYLSARQYRTASPSGGGL